MRKLLVSMLVTVLGCSTLLLAVEETKKSKKNEVSPPPRRHVVSGRRDVAPGRPRQMPMRPFMGLELTKEQRAKVREIMKDAMKKIETDVLTDDQRTKLTERRAKMTEMMKKRGEREKGDKERRGDRNRRNEKTELKPSK